MRFNRVKYFLLIALCNCCVYTVQGQRSVGGIDSALKDNQPGKAERILKYYVDLYIAEKRADSLVNYIYYTGKVAKAASDTKTAETRILALLQKIKGMTANPETLRQACIEAGEFYASVGMNMAGYKLNLEALKHTLVLPGLNGNLKALVENNLATFAQRMGDVNLAMQHARNSAKYLLAEKRPDFETLYISYNGLGSMMWYSSKADSALYYFQKALETLDKTERNATNRFYRPAIILNNLSGLYQLQGKTTLAIRTLESCISHLKKFLAAESPDSKKTAALTFQLEATDNLAGIYKEMGDLKKAGDLLHYSYEQKQKLLSADNPAIFISQILIGQLYYATRDYDKALQFLNSGIRKMASSDGEYLFWQADAAGTLALLHDARKEMQPAAFYYEKADSLYEESLQGEYDNIYLECLRNAALFYAQNNKPQRALSKAVKGYDYVVKTQGGETLLAFNQLLNLAEVNYEMAKYSDALQYSKRGLDVLNMLLQSSENLLDSIRLELKKPLALLQKSKAQYQLLAVKNPGTLSPLLADLKQSLILLERQKTILTDPADIALLMANHSELLEFTKKITLELYQNTRDSAYLDELVSLHESGIYNRIRSRLDKNDSLQFARVPAKIGEEEKMLKKALTTALQGSATHGEKMQRYVEATQNWNKFRERIRSEYPQYYQLRYASIFKSVSRTANLVPPNTTLIRYFFVEKNLFAFVADQNRRQLFPMNHTNLAENITSLAANDLDELKTPDLLFQLYTQLWAPLAKSVKHKKIVIIPDGILYNLNFEILTPHKIRRFSELSEKSLLRDHVISYNYSLFLLNPHNKPADLKNDFVAFAPGFSDKLKKDYEDAYRDSADIDRRYLSLLPQPFSIRLVSRLKALFSGEVFINEQSTKASFIKNAGNNRILHIGTHAESNNEHPEFSRLIFARSFVGGHEENSLFVDEIYQCDLSSELAVLTACESGRPGFQDGEGMISLAHAFNYAGSNSILTGLWKIDEQASAMLLQDFYENLLQGMDKDEALRAAKFSYLASANGRMLSPRYWAGLVIVGDTSPVHLKPNFRNKTAILSGVVAILLLGGIVLMRRRKRSRMRPS